MAQILDFTKARRLKLAYESLQSPNIQRMNGLTLLEAMNEISIQETEKMLKRRLKKQWLIPYQKMIAFNSVRIKCKINSLDKKSLLN